MLFYVMNGRQIQLVNLLVVIRLFPSSCQGTDHKPESASLGFWFAVQFPAYVFDQTVL